MTNLGLAESQNSLTPQRIRVGLIVLVIGVFLVLVAMVMGMVGLRNAAALGQLGAASTIDPATRNIVYLFALVVCGLLALLLMFAFYALVRGNRKYREFLERRAAKATPADDVWTMHKLPSDAPDYDLESDESDEPEEPERPQPGSQ